MLLIDEECASRQRSEKPHALGFRADLVILVRNFDHDVALCEWVNEKVGLAEASRVLPVHKPVVVS